MGTELSVVTKITWLLGNGTGWLHKDPVVTAYEESVSLRNLHPYGYLATAPNM